MWYALLITVLTGYLLGNLNGAVCVSALVANDDVRKHGSGNAGLTNFIRNYGAANGLSVVAIDGMKAIIACLAGGLILAPYGFGKEGMALAGLAVMLGHVFPALLGFKGGKGILSGCFIAITIDWRIGLLALAVFAIAYALTMYVSLGSVLGAAAFGLGFVIFYHTQPWVMVCGVIMSAIAVYMHRSNIMRLIRHEERKTNLFKGGSK